MERRDFLKMSAAAGAAATLSTGFRFYPRVHSLTEELASLAASRLEQLAALREYIDGNEFPINEGLIAIDYTPLFVDHRGVPCAVAYLMIRSGMKTTVDKIARTNNTVRVMDVVDGPLVDWVKVSGLTQEEAARIQPSYGWQRPDYDRIRKHLNLVHEELQTDVMSSLETALSRRRDELSGLQGRTNEILFLPPTQQVDASLANLSSSTLSIRVTPLDAVGLPQDSLENSWLDLPTRDRLDVDESNNWIAVEWRSTQRVASGALRVTPNSLRHW